MGEIAKDATLLPAKVLQIKQPALFCSATRINSKLCNLIHHQPMQSTWHQLG